MSNLLRNWKEKNFTKLRSGEFPWPWVPTAHGPGQLPLGECFILSSKESVKDLIRYLRHEDESRDVRRQLGAAQILQSDLLPILTQHRQDKPLFDAVIRFTPQPLTLTTGGIYVGEEI